jgi:hypothetical protein
MQMDSIFTRRSFLKQLAAVGAAGTILPPILVLAKDNVTKLVDTDRRSLRFILDMVYDNPGEPPFVTKFKDTGVLKANLIRPSCPRVRKPGRGRNKWQHPLTSV